MKKKYLVLIALTVAVTSFSIDPSHARRRGGTSFFAAKPAPVATSAAKPTPAAATRKDDAQARTHFHVTPGVAIRPSNGSAAAGTPMAASAPMAAGAPLDANASTAATETAAPTMGSTPDEANKHAASSTPPAPARRHFVELNPSSPKSQREISPPAPRHAILCFKTATGKCGRFE